MYKVIEEKAELKFFSQKLFAIAWVLEIGIW
jgi:hypothetical protein